MFPKKHSFAYSYLQVAVPVGFEGLCGSFISVGDVKRKGWLHVQGSDYLDRNSSKTTLEDKLSEYLQTQGVNRTDWHHAYLVTAPRILGYSFNPVSFWYLYTADNRLSMMVLEVNNTFDERRMYLLRANIVEEVRTDVIQVEPTQKFKNTWAKDFHVSPFNSRKGFYSLTASDAFVNSTSPPDFDNTIVMSSSKEHAKIIARVFSDGEPIDPTTAGFWSVIRFLMRWGWVGFFTFPRILKEAFKLFFTRKLHVWLRPEVLPTSLGRMATSLEVSLEPFFVAYLHYLVDNSDADLELVYTSPTSGNKPLRFSSIEGQSGDRDMRTLEIRILSPAFFGRYVHYSHTSEAFDREGMFTDEKNRTILVSNPEFLTLLLKCERDISFMKTYLTPLDRLRWNVHRQTRCPPGSPTYPSVQQDKHVVKAKDVRMRPFSPMDRVVQRSGLAWLYRRQCMRLFLAQRLVLGFTPLIDLLDLSIRVFLIHLAITSAFESTQRGLIPSLPKLLLPSLVHVFALFKGSD
ncbi:dna-binding wrky domain-containing protein [Venturia nashicola]|uniref:Dna-binding wrky domain-containing protein n=1 Tax=Venturia nashicola TaxID=86259 RepID=A0A4Z1P8L9_9PEZI|nr:dna-binding wrky domain-containing protein [Venturia nashicola]TLD32525.1 dna-binding wrky domain-containing protein [Venturia nashicola]